MAKSVRRRNAKKNSELMSKIGRLGGLATAARHDANYYHEISMKRKSFKGGRPRKKKKPPQVPSEAVVVG